MCVYAGYYEGNGVEKGKKKKGILRIHLFTANR